MDFLSYILFSLTYFYIPVIGDCITLDGFHVVEKNLDGSWSSLLGQSGESMSYKIVDIKKDVVIAKSFDEYSNKQKTRDYYVAIPKSRIRNSYDYGHISGNICILRSNNMSKMEQ